MAQFTEDERAMARLPECQAAWDSLIEARVSVQKAYAASEKAVSELHAIFDAIKQRGTL